MDHWEKLAHVPEGEQEVGVLTDNNVQRASRASLHWSLLMKRHYILTGIYIKLGEGQKHVIHWKILPATPREDKDLNQNSHTRENAVNSLKIAHCPTYWQPVGYALPRIAMNMAQPQLASLLKTLWDFFIIYF